MVEKKNLTEYMSYYGYILGSLAFGLWLKNWWAGLFMCFVLALGSQAIAIFNIRMAQLIQSLKKD